MGLMKKLAAVIGLALVAVSVANVEFGALMGLDPPQKLILAKMVYFYILLQEKERSLYGIQLMEQHYTDLINTKAGLGRPSLH